jgi:hypoxanthine phosphoribosyltransferase/tRNA threonylcarbamoyladenosine modification (KEOPS) complex Cgi121 subunit
VEPNIQDAAKPSRRNSQERLKPDIIIAISRGGWLPARVLSDLLETVLANVSVGFCLGVAETKDEPVLTRGVSAAVTDKKVLSVDDVADTGKSLELVKEHILQQGAKEVRTVTVYHKPWSVVKPNYYQKETRLGVVFPWEIRETIKRIFEKRRDKSASIEEGTAKLVKAGLPKQLAERFLKEMLGGNLLRYIEEDGEYVETTGFRNVKIEDAEGFLRAIRKEKQQNTAVQLFNAELVATWQHLYFAVLNALTAFRNKSNISKNVAIEIMLYASAQRQIRKAIALLGVRPSSANVAVVIIGEDSDSVKMVLSAVSKLVGAEPDEEVLELSEGKMQSIREAFDISERELRTVMKKNGLEEALFNLVVERMALLATQL